MNKTIKIILIVSGIIILLMGLVVVVNFTYINKIKKTSNTITTTKAEVSNVSEDFSMKLINNMNISYSTNYLVSPYSIEIGLSILEQGASGTTKEQLDNLLKNDDNTPADNVKNHIINANALFINSKYKTDIKETYINNIKDKYKADAIYDEFKTPEVINKWGYEKTNGMIPEILSSISPEFRLGIANALYLDLPWRKTFDCRSNHKDVFTNSNEKINVTMMNEFDNDTEYLKNDEAVGIIKEFSDYSYDENTDEEQELPKFNYIAIMPKGDLKEYVKNLTMDKLNKLIKTKEKYEGCKIDLSIPRYNYEYNFETIKEELMAIGLNNMFDPDKAEFSNMANTSLYVDEFIHKTAIEFNEAGTKAAAVTFASMNETATAVGGESKTIEITFNKPFIYLIMNENKIWFFGVVNSPNEYAKDTNCQ